MAFAAGQRRLAHNHPGTAASRPSFSGAARESREPPASLTTGGASSFTPGQVRPPPHAAASFASPQANQALQASGSSGLAAVNEPHRVAADGFSGTPGPLPHKARIARAFGRHSVDGVQAHTGGPARAANNALGASAYSMDGDVAFSGMPDLHTAAHEAAHVVQQRSDLGLAGGVGRRGDAHERNADSVAAAVVENRSAEPLLDRYAAGPSPAGPALQFQQGPAPKSQSKLPPATADKRLTTINNSEFLIEMVSAQGKGVSAERRAAVEAERKRRVSLGHEWLEPNLAATPTDFVRLLPSRWGATVLKLDTATALGPPIDTRQIPVLTASQFDLRRRQLSIPTIAASSMLGPAGAARPGPPAPNLPTIRPGPRGTPAAPYIIVDPVPSPAGLHTVEVHMPNAGLLLPWEVLVGSPAVQELADPGGTIRAGRPTVETLAQLNTRQPGNRFQLRALTAYHQGQWLGLGSDMFVLNSTGDVGGYSASVELTGGVGRAVLARRMVDALRHGLTVMALTVNDHSRQAPAGTPDGLSAVERFHATIQADADYTGGVEPRAGNKYWLNQQQMARLAVAWNAATTPQELAALQMIAAGTQGGQTALSNAARPNANALYLGHLQNLDMQGGFQQQFRARAANPLTPEFAATQRYGSLRAGGRAFGMGTGFGSILGLGTDALFTALSGGSWNAFAGRVPQTAVVGGVGGGVSMATEQALVSYVSQRLVAQGHAPNLGSGLRLIGSRVVAGGVGAGVAEVVLIFGFERDRSHSTGEVVGRVARSTGIGLVSAGTGTLATTATTSLIGTVLASGGTGAASGSVVPGWGTALGFLVGIGAGVLTYVVLDHAIPKVKK